jgi:hypothetical protein
MTDAEIAKLKQTLAELSERLLRLAEWLRKRSD